MLGTGHVGYARWLAGLGGEKNVYRTALPQLNGEVFLTDSGLETDLTFNGGFDLPEFAAFVLVEDTRGVAALEAYYRRHVDIAVQHGCGVILEAPTWRASRDWGARIGYPAAELRRVNQSAVDLLSGVRGDYLDSAGTPVVVSGCIGPRADAYRPAERNPRGHGRGPGTRDDHHIRGRGDRDHPGRRWRGRSCRDLVHHRNRGPPARWHVFGRCGRCGGRGHRRRAGLLRDQLRAPFALRASPPQRCGRGAHPER